ncbi:MAG: carboxylate-amine ligase [Balneolales bacterium]
MSKSFYDYTVGIEEEYQLVNTETGELNSAIDILLKEKSEDEAGNKITSEMMQCQVEIGTKVCTSLQEAREQLVSIRRTVSNLARNHGLSIVAAGSHPFSKWKDQDITERARYRGLELENKRLARQLLVCGMHMHIGMDDDDARIDIMNQLSYFCPHLLCLSASSPFWGGHDTGLQSYRSVIFECLPRTGIPPKFRSWSDYQEFLDLSVQLNCIDEPTKIRWDIRPSPKFPTLEIRIADVCPKLDETIAICALKIALVAKLKKMQRSNQSWRHYRKELIQENKWRAVRYGLNGKLLDLGRKREEGARKLIFQLLTFVDDVVDDLGITEEISGIHNILADGNSADRQLAVYKENNSTKDVVDLLKKETMLGIEN